MSGNTDLEVAIPAHIHIVDQARAGYPLTVCAIAQRFGLSKRTAQRYIERVSRLYVPLEYDTKTRTWRKMEL